jgi:hypothetical protein
LPLGLVGALPQAAAACIVLAAAESSRSANAAENSGVEAKNANELAHQALEIQIAQAILAHAPVIETEGCPGGEDAHSAGASSSRW